MVLRNKDAATGKALVDVIADEAEQKGTGRWTAQSALDLGVPLISITEAVFARMLSARRAQRAEAERRRAPRFHPNSGDRRRRRQENLLPNLHLHPTRHGLVDEFREAEPFRG